MKSDLFAESLFNVFFYSLQSFCNKLLRKGTLLQKVQITHLLFPQYFTSIKEIGSP